MTKSEFLLRLENEVVKSNVSDREDILEEYNAHFDFKIAEGYSEDAVAESLGDPVVRCGENTCGQGQEISFFRCCCMF